jgi:perosamine synthetase
MEDMVTQMEQIKMSAGTLDFNAFFCDTAKFYKKPFGLTDLSARAIDVLGANGETIAYLVPFSHFDLGDTSRISLLSKWRTDHSYAYPTQFSVTSEGTRAWLENAVLANPNRLLFWITDIHMKPLGHLGLLLLPDTESLEVDNVLRGTTEVPGLMEHAMRTLEDFGKKEFSVGKVTLRVLSSNGHAVEFYTRIGYNECSRESLTRIIDGDMVKLESGPAGDDYFITMEKSLEHNQEVPDLILTAGPDIGARERAYTFDAVSTGWNSQHSKYLNKFEQEFAQYVGAKYAMATSSCTGALHLSLLALGIGPGDEVIVPDITWVATASAVMYVGATPIFADVDKNTWLMTDRDVEPLITKQTKAIIPVHLYGFGVQMEQISALARRHNLFVVEDAAPAIGTIIGERAAGTFGHFGCYSFQGAKMLVTGEGGMIVTDNETLYAKARKIQDHGRKPGTFWIEELGYKYKMSNATAALGLGQLERGEQQIVRKRRIRTWYEEEFKGLDSIRMQHEDQGTRSIHWMSSIVLEPDSPISRDTLINMLKLEGIDSRPVFPAISQYPFWPLSQEPKSNAFEIGENGINLPSGVNLSRDSVSKIGEIIRRLIKK